MDSENEGEEIEIEVMNVCARWRWPMSVTNEQLREIFPEHACPTFPNRQDRVSVALERSGVGFFVNEQDITCKGAKSEEAVRKNLTSFAREALEKVRIHLQPKRVETKKKKKKKKAQ